MDAFSGDDFHASVQGCEAVYPMVSVDHRYKEGAHRQTAKESGTTVARAAATRHLSAGRASRRISRTVGSAVAQRPSCAPHPSRRAPAQEKSRGPSPDFPPTERARSPLLRSSPQSAHSRNVRTVFAARYVAAAHQIIGARMLGSLHEARSRQIVPHQRAEVRPRGPPGKPAQ